MPRKNGRTRSTSSINVVVELTVNIIVGMIGGPREISADGHASKCALPSDQNSDKRANPGSSGLNAASKSGMSLFQITENLAGEEFNAEKRHFPRRPRVIEPATN